MEPTNFTNHPFRKENDLNQTSIFMFQPLIFRGVSLDVVRIRERFPRQKTYGGFFGDFSGHQNPALRRENGNS